MKKVLLIIPAYNEEKNLPTVQQEILAYKNQDLPFVLDYLVINDGSTDATRAVCEQAGIHVLHLPINLGIGGAVQTGYVYAMENCYDIAVQFDGDGQHDLAYLKVLLAPLLAETCQFSVGSRFLKPDGNFRSSRLRRMGIRMLSVMLRICTGLRITDPTSGFRAADRSVITYLADHYPRDYPEPESLAELKRNRFCIEEVSVEMRERVEGTSSINFARSIYYMIKVSLAIVCKSFERREQGHVVDSQN